MAQNLNRKIGEMAYDGLIANIIPPIQTAGGTVAKLSAAATYGRGTVLAKSANTAKLYILGSEATEGDTLTPDCILCDNEDIGTSADVAVAVYTGGCFNPNKVTVADGYTMTEADKDKLRERGIVFKAAFPEN